MPAKNEHGLSRRIGSAVLWRGAQLAGERGISVVRFLVLARILAPVDFGLLAIATIAMEVLLGLTNVGMVPALVQRPDVENRHYHAAWTIRLMRSGAITAALIAAAPLIAEAFAEPDATGLVRLIALQPLFDALGSIRVADLERSLNFRALAAVNLAGALTHTAVAISLAPAIGVQGVVWGLLAGQAVGMLISYGVAPYRPRVSFDRSAARELLSFGRWILATGLVAVAGEAALRIVISRQLGAVELGAYYLAARLIGIPNGVVSVILGAVAFPVYARLQAQAARAVSVFRATLTSSTAVLAPTYGLLLALAPGLVAEILGGQWSTAVPVIRVLSVAALIGVLADAVIPLLEGKGQPRKVTWLILTRTVLVIGLAWPLTTRFALTGAALAVLGAELAAQLMAGRMALGALPVPFGGVARPLAAIAGAAAAGAGVAFGIYGIAANLAGFLLAVGAAVLITALILWLLDRRLDLGFVALATAAFPKLAQTPMLRRS